MAVGAVPAAEAAERARAPQPPPSALGCDGVRHATPIAGDVGPDGRPVRTSRDARGRYVPVVLVHGWTSRSTHVAGRTGAFSSTMDLSTNRVHPVAVPRSLIGQLQRVPGVEAFTFDYEQHSARWVTADQLGPRLGRAVDCLHARTGEEVIVVGHSMGGLLARFAAAQPVDGAPDRSARISRVITFGSPQAGSAVAQGVISGLDAAALVSKPAAVLRLLLAECGAVSTGQLVSGSLCDVLPAFVRAFDSEAGRGLRVGSAQLQVLPAFPAAVDVHALLGEATFRVPRSGWFALPWQTDGVPVGDLIVPSGSARTGATTATTAACAYQLNAVRGATDRVGLAVRMTSAVDVATQPLGAVSGPCFHTSLMRTVELTNEATALVREDVESRAAPPPSPADDVAWWEDQTYPEGWESAETVAFEGGRCVDADCPYSLQAVHVAPGPQGPVGTVLLYVHDGDGWPLGQTLLVLSAQGEELTLLRASDTATTLAQEHALCDVTIAPVPGGVRQTFSECLEPAGNGTVLWRHAGGSLLRPDPPR